MIYTNDFSILHHNWGLSPKTCNLIYKTVVSNCGSIPKNTFQLTLSPDRKPTHWMLPRIRRSQVCSNPARS